MKFLNILFIITSLTITFSCGQQDTNAKNSNKTNGKDSITSTFPNLSLSQANALLELPLSCLQTEYPNKLGQVLGDSLDIASPKSLHPSFYGCFDWHSAVHGHWSAIKLVKDFPDLSKSQLIIDLVKENLTRENIQQELNYFLKKNNTSYERTYGWAWLLKLSEELHTWDSPLARDLESNLQPLTDLIVERYIDFLPKLHYPIRVGEHTNTAFGLSFALDYALVVHNLDLSNAIKKRAREFYFNDCNCPLNWEPSGYDFLSPCLEEINLMSKVLDSSEFLKWLKLFYPDLLLDDFNIEVGIVSDRSDGKLVHLDGLNFSRAWVMYSLSNNFNELKHLRILADTHVNYSLPNLVGDSYEGGHWLASFAIYALDKNVNLARVKTRKPTSLYSSKYLS